MAYLTVGGFVCRVVAGTATEPPRLYQGARSRMFDNSPISTERDDKRVLECEVDLYSLDEEDELRTACPRGEAVPIGGDWPGAGFDGLVDIGNAPANDGEAEDGEPVWKTVSLHIEQA